MTPRRGTARRHSKLSRDFTHADLHPALSNGPPQQTRPGQRPLRQSRVLGSSDQHSKVSMKAGDGIWASPDAPRLSPPSPPQHWLRCLRISHQRQLTHCASFCEEDYAVTRYIAEFFNTLTNLAYGECGPISRLYWACGRRPSCSTKPKPTLLQYTMLSNHRVEGD